MLKKRKVLFLASWFPEKDNPAFGIFILKHAKVALQICDTVVLYVSARNQSEGRITEYAVEEGLPVLRVYYKKSGIHLYPLLVLIQAWRYLRASYAGFCILKKKFGRFDIIHANAAIPSGMAAFFLKATKNIPYVITEHGSFYTDFDGGLKKSPIYVRCLLFLIFRYADAVSAISSYLLQELREKKLAPANVTILGNIVDIPPVINLKRDSRKINVLFIGLLVDKDKNISGLINAFAKLSSKYKDIYLHIIGDGDDRDLLEILAAKSGTLNTRIFFHGFVANDRLCTYFSTAHLFVLNSNYETFSVATAEAIAHGIPAVVTKCGGPQEFINEETGILVERQNEASLIAGLEYMINNWHRYAPETLRAYAREYFDISKISDTLKATYDRVAMSVFDARLASPLRGICAFLYERIPHPTFLVKAIFHRIYRSSAFGGKESASGSGSDTVQTKVLLAKVSSLIRENRIKSLIDAPCGDFCWMRHLDMRLDQYIGIDIVPEIISRNKANFSRNGQTFMVRNIIVDVLPKADMILCRDCLVHFSFRDIFSTLKNFKKSGSVFLLTTTFTRHPRNVNILTGEWRPLNLEIAPFNFPHPLKIINEECSECNGYYMDNSLGLWRLDDIKIRT